MIVSKDIVKRERRSGVVYGGSKAPCGEALGRREKKRWENPKTDMPEPN